MSVAVILISIITLATSIIPAVAIRTQSIINGGPCMNPINDGKKIWMGYKKCFCENLRAHCYFDIANANHPGMLREDQMKPEPDWDELELVEAHKEFMEMKMYPYVVIKSASERRKQMKKTNIYRQRVITHRYYNRL